MVKYTFSNGTVIETFTNEMGQFEITDCADEKVNFEVEGYCDNKTVTLENGNHVVPVLLKAKTSEFCIWERSIPI